MGLYVIGDDVAAPNSDDHLQKEQHQVPANPRSYEFSSLLSTHEMESLENQTFR